MRRRLAPHFGVEARFGTPPSGESGEGLYADMSLTRSSSQAAVLRARRRKSLPFLLGPRFAAEICGHVLEGDEVLGCVVGSDPAGVVAEGHIHDPMEAVLDSPMVTHDGADVLGVELRGCQVMAGFASAHAVGLASGFDDDEPGEARPFMTFLQPANIVNDDDATGFDAPVFRCARDRHRPSRRH